MADTINPNIGNLWAAAIGSNIAPNKFFQGMETEGSYLFPILFSFLMMFAGAILWCVFPVQGAATAEFSLWSCMMHMLQMMMFGGLASAIASIVMYPVWKKLGSPHGFEAAFRSVAFSLGIVPLLVLLMYALGQFFPNLYMLIRPLYLAAILSALWLGLMLTFATVHVHKVPINSPWTRTYPAFIATVFVFWGVTIAVIPAAMLVDEDRTANENTGQRDTQNETTDTPASTNLAANPNQNPNNPPSENIAERDPTPINNSPANGTKERTIEPTQGRRGGIEIDEQNTETFGPVEVYKVPGGYRYVANTSISFLSYFITGGYDVSSLPTNGGDGPNTLADDSVAANSATTQNRNNPAPIPGTVITRIISYAFFFTYEMGSGDIFGKERCEGDATLSFQVAGADRNPNDSIQATIFCPDGNVEQIDSSN